MWTGSITAEETIRPLVDNNFIVLLIVSTWKRYKLYCKLPQRVFTVAKNSSFLKLI